MNKIVVFGSINTDLSITAPYIPEDGETVKGSAFFINEGGKGANQAVAASLLGGNVQMIASIGDDGFARDSLVALKKYGVGTTYVKITNSVGSGVAVIIKISGDNRIIIDPASNDILESGMLLEYSKKHRTEGSIFITQLENKIEENFKALKHAKELGMITIFNPAPAVEIPKEVFKNVDILIINQTEAKIIAGIYPYTYKDELEIYYKLKDLGIKHLIITLGVKGSVVFYRDFVDRVSSYKVEAVDSTGAGDAYIGAIAYKLSLGEDLITSARFASAAAALAVTKGGAQRAMPKGKEVDDFILKNMNESVDAKERINDEKTDHN